MSCKATENDARWYHEEERYITVDEGQIRKQLVWEYPTHRKTGSNEYNGCPEDI